MRPVGKTCVEIKYQAPRHGRDVEDNQCHTAQHSQAVTQHVTAGLRRDVAPVKPCYQRGKLLRRLLQRALELLGLPKRVILGLLEEEAPQCIEDALLL